MTNEPSRSIPIAQYWGVIRGQIAARATTAQLWSAVRNAAAAEGYTTLTGGLAEMNRLRGLGTGLRAAAERFAKARGSAGIESSMFAPDVSARSIPGLSVTPTYRVSFVHTTVDLQGILRTQYRIVSFPLQLPSTKDALIAELDADAGALAGKYGEQHLSVGHIEIAVV